MNSPLDTDFYSQFTATYPDYRGSRNNFTWALVYIEWLRKARQLLHRSLCDDFIRVISFEYVDYVRACQGKAKTGWQYYDENVLKQEYSMQVITPENLHQALSTLDPERVQKIRSAFEQPHESTPMQSQGSKVITHTQTQAVPAPYAQKQDQVESGPLTQSQPIQPTPPAPALAPVSSTAKTSRSLPWTKKPSPVKDSNTSSLRNKTEQLTAPVEPLSSIRKIPSQGPLKPKHTSADRTRIIPASPKYVNLVEEEAWRESIFSRAASPILGSRTPPSASDNKWRKATENVKRKKEEQSRQRSSLPTQPEPASSKRKPILQPDDMLQPLKRPRIVPQKGHNATSFKPQKSHSPTSSLRSARVPTPTFQAPSLSAIKSSSSSASTPADGVSKVNGWLNMKPNPKRTSANFAEFVKKRRESGKFSSRASTPAGSIAGKVCPKPREVLAGDSRPGTPMGSMRSCITGGSMVDGGRSFCTKSKVVEEPKTQSWGYER